MYVYVCSSPFCYHIASQLINIHILLANKIATCAIVNHKLNCLYTINIMIDQSQSIYIDNLLIVIARIKIDTAINICTR